MASAVISLRDADPLFAVGVLVAVASLSTDERGEERPRLRTGLSNDQLSHSIRGNLEHSAKRRPAMARRKTECFLRTLFRQQLTLPANAASSDREVEPHWMRRAHQRRCHQAE
jgi:hypothetical protein